jgi:hypothetical protein
MEVIPKRNPHDGPNTRAAMMRANQIGSSPAAPAPSGLKRVINALITPRSAIDFASIDPIPTSEIRRKAEAAIATTNIQ